MKLWCFRISRWCHLPSSACFVLHFQERSLTLDQPVKIGRSVARARAAPNNAIFDCKVLSRNHALLWYENGKVLNLITLHVRKVIHVYCHIHSTKLCMFYIVQFMHECPLHMKILPFTLEHIFFYLYHVQCYVSTKHDLCIWLYVSAESYQTNFCIDIYQCSKSE